MSLQAQPPLPAPPVLTPPSGWLGFLGIKSGGAQPKQVAGFLQPTIEMDRYYRAGGRQILVPVTGLPMVYNGSTAIVAAAQVPQGHVWHLEHVQANSTALGVAAGVVACLLVTDPGGTIVASSDMLPRAYATGEIANMFLRGPIVALPGYALRVFTTAAAAPTAFSWALTAVGQDVLA